MDLVENIREGLNSIKVNLLRTVLTALIITFGITALVGILTAIDGIQFSVTSNLTDVGLRNFDVRNKRASNVVEGRTQRRYEPLKMKEFEKFNELYTVPASISLQTNLTNTAEVKQGSLKTDPNVAILGSNEESLALNGIDILRGRNFSSMEIQYGANVAILGYTVWNKLLGSADSLENAEISYRGTRYKVIGLLEEKGNFGGGSGGPDNSVYLPYINTLNQAGGRSLQAFMIVGVPENVDMDYAMGEATMLMRKIRGDGPGEEDSFELNMSKSIAERMAEITGGLRIGGFVISFITLLGACIALMNIMLVTVTERTREIGIRKALGATSGRIRQQFLIEAIVICLLGGLAGVILGIIAGNVTAGLMNIEGVVIPWLWIAVGLSVCVIVGLLSGYYPANKASKLDPIESLRFE